MFYVFIGELIALTDHIGRSRLDILIRERLAYVSRHPMLLLVSGERIGLGLVVLSWHATEMFPPRSFHGIDIGLRRTAVRLEPALEVKIILLSPLQPTSTDAANLEPTPPSLNSYRNVDITTVLRVACAPT